MSQCKAASLMGRKFAGLFLSAIAALMLSAFSNAALAEKVNLNTANAEALQYIPGIGPGKSAEIIRVRQASGGFKSMEDLLAVPGIGEKVLLEVKRFGSLRSGVSVLTEEMENNPPRRSVSAKSKHADSAG